MKLSTLSVLVWAAPAAATLVKKTKTNMSCDGDFNDGVYLGADVAEKMWKEQGSSCSKIWGFEDQVDDYLDAKYPTDTSDWRKNSCHEGMQKGADQVVDKYEKQCLGDSPDECYDLGQAAAQMIAFDYCPFSAADEAATAYGQPNYKASCRSVAYGVCEGAIYGYVRDNGCSISTSKLSYLQDECEDQVDSMTGGDEEEKVVNVASIAHKTSNIDFLKASAAVKDLANCFRKCESKFAQGSSSIETCRSNCRAGNNRTGRDYKNSRSSGSYTDGVTQGKQEAERIWRNNGSTCNYIWNFEDDVEDMLDRKYSADTRYNEGVADGAEIIVEKYERQCLNSSPDECNDLGQAAAQIIAYDYCPFSAADAAGYSSIQPDYKATCRDVAEGICEGAIYGYVRDNGCSITTSALNNLQDDCEDQIYSMTSGAAAKRNLRKN